MAKKLLFLCFVFFFFIKCSNQEAGGPSTQKFADLETRRQELRASLQPQIDKLKNLSIRNSPGFGSTNGFHEKKNFINSQIEEIKSQIENLDDPKKISIGVSINELKIQIGRFELLVIAAKKDELNSLFQVQKQREKKLLNKYIGFLSNSDLLTQKTSIATKVQEIESQIENLENPSDTSIEALINNLQIQIDDFERAIEKEQKQIKTTALEAKQKNLINFLKKEIKRKNELDKEYDIYSGLRTFTFNTELFNLRYYINIQYSTSIQISSLKDTLEIPAIKASIVEFSQKIDDYKAKLREKLTQTIKYFDVKIRNIQNKKKEADFIFTDLKEKQKFETLKKVAELAIENVRNLVLKKIKTFSDLGKEKVNINRFINEAHQKVEDYFKEVDDQKTKQESFPEKNYLKLARDFHELMRDRYSFWGDGDSWEEFHRFYENKKDIFRSIPISNRTQATSLFQEWIENLTDQHFRIKFGFSRPDRYLSIIKSTKRQKKGQYKQNFYSGYQTILRDKFDFNILDSAKNINITLGSGRTGEQLIGFLKEKNFLYLGMTLFAFIDNQKIKEINKNIQHTKGIIIDLRYHPGGTTIKGDWFNYNFLENNKLIGCSKERTNTNPITQKSSWKNRQYDLLHSRSSNLERINNIYDLPIVIIVNEHTSSLAEYVTATLRMRKNVLVLGERTAGLFSPYMPLRFMSSSLRSPYKGGQFELKHEGENLLVTIATGVYKFSEDETEGKGLIPDVPLTSSEMSNDLKPLEKAIKILEEGNINQDRKESLREIYCN